MPIVGEGDYRYEYVDSWPKMPKYWSFGMVSDGAVNSKDEVHVFSRGKHPLTVWDTDGNFISSWGEGTFSAMPHGICIAPNDNVWLVDRDYHTVTEYTPSGQTVRTLGQKGAPTAAFHGTPFNMPSGVALAPSGDIFVSDGYGNHRDHRFSPDGELLHSWGREGTGPGEFTVLHNIGVDSRGRVFICDRNAQRIQIFDEDGTYLEEWTKARSPGDVWIQDDVVYLIEQGGESAVSLWTLEGELITRWSGREGPGKGTMSGGHGICVDSQGSIYVMGSGTPKFQRI